MKKSITLLFPGQGAQYVGMGKNFIKTEEEVYLDKACEVLGHDLKSIMLEGPEEQLKLTQNTQPALLTHSMAHLSLLKKECKKLGVTIERVMGHSVGEYAALCCAGVLGFEEAVLAVHLRGKYMQEAVPVGKGKMVALMKVPAQTIEQLCKECSSSEEQVMPANFNDPGQTVISGDAAACDRAQTWLKENYNEPYRAVELEVSAPFHSGLMYPAAKKLEQKFEDFTFNKNEIAYIANIDAKEYPAGTDSTIIRNNLVGQVAGSVRWSQSFASLPDDTKCIEVGAGRVLMGLARKINRNIKVLSLDKEGAMDDLGEFLS